MFFFISSILWSFCVCLHRHRCRLCVGRARRRVCVAGPPTYCLLAPRTTTTVHLYTPNNESVTDFFIESLVNNVSAGRFVSTESGYMHSRPKASDGVGNARQKSKQYGNEKTSWSQQHTYPLSMPSADATNHHRTRPNAMRTLRMDESGIEYVDSSSPRVSDKPGDETSDALPTIANETATASDAAVASSSNKNVNKRRKRVEKRNSNEAKHCADEQAWSEWLAADDGVQHSVRRWTYNSTSYANKTVSFR